MSSFVTIPAGQFVFREGEPGSEMYIIETGAVEILREVRGPEPIAVLEPGDFFGEMAILEDQPRFASARAKESSRLLKIDRAAFAGLIQQNFEIAVRIMRKLAARLRRTEQLLQDTQAELQNARRVAARAPTREDVRPPGPVPPRPPAGAAATAPRPSAGLKLVHPESGSEYLIPVQAGELLIGRPDPVTGVTPEINLGPLDLQRTLSRRHAKLVNESGMVFVREEVGTTNGTFLNGERLRTGAATPLKPGDRVRFGAIELLVQAV